MKLTDEIRKRLSDYQFETKDKLTDVSEKTGITYETLRQFWTGQSEASGNTLNKLDEFLKEKGI